jgi:hypothetical protein
MAVVGAPTMLYAGMYEARGFSGCCGVIGVP